MQGHRFTRFIYSVSPEFILFVSSRSSYVCHYLKILQEMFSPEGHFAKIMT